MAKHMTKHLIHLECLLKKLQQRLGTSDELVLDVMTELQKARTPCPLPTGSAPRGALPRPT